MDAKNIHREEYWAVLNFDHCICAWQVGFIVQRFPCPMWKLLKAMQWLRLKGEWNQWPEHCCMVQHSHFQMFSLFRLKTKNAENLEHAYYTGFTPNAEHHAACTSLLGGCFSPHVNFLQTCADTIESIFEVKYSLEVNIMLQDKLFRISFWCRPVNSIRSSFIFIWCYNYWQRGKNNWIHLCSPTFWSLNVWISWKSGWNLKEETYWK